MSGKLYLVSTPIGNPDDITLRALQILKSVDFIICEEFKVARRLLSGYSISKELVSLNEHNESEEAPSVISRIKKGESAALMSDCGTPLFSDPGHILVSHAVSTGIKIIPLPGASSILPALITSNFDFEKFYYYGWLSPKKEIRRKELLNLKRIKETIVLMDTPYRLKAVLTDIAKLLGNKISIVVAFQITMEGEEFIRGSVEKVLHEVEKRNLKGEYVLILRNK
jgi:16S rRNA (cytidine1402-2'-O)-methyltransferase